MCSSAAHSRHSHTSTRGASTQKKGVTLRAMIIASALCKRCNACTKNIPLYESPSAPCSRCMHSRSKTNCFFIETSPSLAPHRASFDFEIYPERSFCRVLMSLEEELKGQGAQRKVYALERLSRIMPRQRRQVNNLLELIHKLKFNGLFMAVLAS